MVSSFLQGFVLQASLILALGAQNLFILNSGLLKQRHFLTATVSALCDTFLIFVGVLGVATFFIEFPIMKIGLGIIGVVFLFYYGVLKLKEAKLGAAQIQFCVYKLSVKKTILTSLGFSLLNPHVYLDTVVLIGGYSAKFEQVTDRLYFGSGAAAFSIVWFFALVTLASFASSVLSSTKAMRFISLGSGLLLCGLALKLGIEVASWIKLI